MLVRLNKAVIGGFVPTFIYNVQNGLWTLYYISLYENNKEVKVNKKTTLTYKDLMLRKTFFLICAKNDDLWGK